MNSEQITAAVAVEGVCYHFDDAYTYLVPSSLQSAVLPGCRVSVPFGNGNRKRQGFVLSCGFLSETDGSKLKSVAAVLDKAPLFDDEGLKLIQWLSENTFCTLYEAARAMLPAGLGLSAAVTYRALALQNELQPAALSEEEEQVYRFLSGKNGFIARERLLKALSLPSDSDVPERLIKKKLLISNIDLKQKTGDYTIRNARLALSEEAIESRLSGLTPKQKSVAKLLLDIGCASVKEVCYFTGVTSAVVSALEKKGLIETFDSEMYRRPKMRSKITDNIEAVLTAEQQAAFEKLLAVYRAKKGGCSLLFGVTGSGKTQVFLKLIEQVVADGKGVIVMVPEIALTPQTLEIFYSRFGDQVALFHSALSAGERMDEWKRVKRGEANIVVGTRSAVFAPLSNLGLIVMDEEQEHTYKSEMSPRYHARDVAKMRGAFHSAPVVLSSATPSLETYRNASQGRYGLVKLTERYGPAVLPEVITVDMSDEKGVLSARLCAELSACLEEKKQAILLINRRGFNTFAVCNACKKVLTCPNCSVSLTYHSANGRLMCHSCGHSERYTEKCPYCGENAVRYSGYGTQRIEEEITRLFPVARLLRMDADTTLARYAYDDKLTAFANGEYDIMLGTQMVAKGLDFSRVTLVGIVSIDQQLYNDDFRSSEKAFDLLTQVIGRSGRGDFEGKAVIQTMLPENDVIQLASQQDYESFYATESVIRKAMLYPPFCDLCSVGFTSESMNRALFGANAFLEQLKKEVEAEYSDVKLIVLGPLQPRIGKVSNKYRWLLTIKCKNNRRFRAMMSSLLKAFMKNTAHAGIAVFADMNPLN